jgi:hypothetical protein
MFSWRRDGVVYQVYPRSFQDADGDGSGDLQGICRRLDHVAWLGADALWLSPVYPSPMADMGYDVSDYTDVDPLYGTLADADALVAGAHARGLKLLMDVVPCHTSIEHPWFREHPDWYVWSDRDGPQNNWRAAFGGPAWSRDERSGRWYLHSFYPEQPDLDWRRPEVRAAMGDVLRFWLDRGSLLWLYKDLIALRRGLGGGLELLDGDDGVIAFRRGAEHVVALNLAGEERPAPAAGTMLCHTHGATGDAPRRLLPGEGFLANFAG